MSRSSGLRVIGSCESTGATAARQADRRRSGRASTSFSMSEAWWLDRVLYALSQGDHARLRELAGDPVGARVSQKALVMRRAAEKDSERRTAEQAARDAETVASGTTHGATQ